MAEYVNEDKPIIFKNETDSDFNVGVGVIFRKSGIYEISINDKTTTVTKVSERKTGHWIPMTCKYEPGAEGFPYLIKKWTEAAELDDISGLKCSECGEIFDFEEARKWCCECGAKMEDENEAD